MSTSVVLLACVVALVVHLLTYKTVTVKYLNQSAYIYNVYITNLRKLATLWNHYYAYTFATLNNLAELRDLSLTYREVCGCILYAMRRLVVNII